MAEFIASAPVLFKDKDNKKWCVRYTLTTDGVTYYKKEYGKSYQIKLNYIRVSGNIKPNYF